MAFATGMVLIAFGASLFYKGYKGYSWSQFYGAVFSGSAGASSAPPLTSSQKQTVAKPAQAGAAAAGKAASTVTSFLKGG